MKLILLFLFLLTISIKAQTERPVYRNIVCDEELEYDKIKIVKDEYDYKIISLSYRVENSDTIFIGDLIIPNFNAKSDTIHLKNVLQHIGKKERFSEFLVYGDCESREISHQAAFPTDKQRKHLNLFRIGEFHLE